jgi:methylenetetrahydrofolate reductase (NADPH)
LPTFSFEMYPPRSIAAALGLSATVDHLVAAGPEFISVTYGASGSTREASLDVLRHLMTTPVAPMAHLTCIGWTYAEATRVIREFLDAGITSFLAIRGDPPVGRHEGEDFLGDLKSAGELVQLIQAVQSEREPFAQVDVPGFPQSKRIARGQKVTIGVAAFPNGHPRSRSVRQDLDTLLAKQAAGANLAITQLFFVLDDYLRFVDLARDAGVTMRILPGIMPIVSTARLTRMIELTGERMPEALLARLGSGDSAQQQYAIGIEHAATLAGDLLAAGVSGLHLYTYNQHQAVLDVLDAVGMLATPSNKEQP